MQVAYARSYKHQISGCEVGLVCFFCMDLFLGWQNFFIFVVWKLVVFILVFDLVVLGVVQLSVHKLEIHAHVRMIVERHDSALLDEEEDEAIVLISNNGDTIEFLLEMVFVRFGILTNHSKCLMIDAVHSFYYFLAHRFRHAVIQEFSGVAFGSWLQTHLFYCVYQGFHWYVFCFFYLFVYLWLN